MKICFLILATIFISSISSFSQNDITRPLRSVYRKDVDGDRKPDTFIYEVKRWETEYEGLLKIVSAKGRVLWEHHFLMLRKDVFGDPNWLGGRGLENHVKYFFAKGSLYGSEVEHIKLKASDFDPDQITYAAKLAGITLSKLRRDILSQRINTVFEYRAEWREDLMSIVYVPSLRKFVCYHRGY